MANVAFDTLKLARKLEAAGFPPKQAADTAEALGETVGGDIATKDFVRAELRDLDQRMTIKLGGMLVVAVGAMAALAKLL